MTRWEKGTSVELGEGGREGGTGEEGKTQEKKGERKEWAMDYMPFLSAETGGKKRGDEMEDVDC